jgi:hypothetical protein
MVPRLRGVIEQGTMALQPRGLLDDELERQIRQIHHLCQRFGLVHVGLVMLAMMELERPA